MLYDRRALYDRSKKTYVVKRKLRCSRYDSPMTARVRKEKELHHEWHLYYDPLLGRRCCCCCRCLFCCMLLHGLVFRKPKPHSLRHFDVSIGAIFDARYFSLVERFAAKAGNASVEASVYQRVVHSGYDGPATTTARRLIMYE